MSKMLRNVVIAFGVAFAVSFTLALLGSLAHSPDAGSNGTTLGAAIGIIVFFILHLRGANRRVAPADAQALASALSFNCPPGRALLYFVRTGFGGKAVGVDIDVDGKTVAQIKSPRFTCLTVTPGTHELTAHVGNGTSALSPATAKLSAPLAAGSVTLLHIRIKQGLVKSQLEFEPWTLDTAKARLAEISMVMPEVPTT